MTPPWPALAVALALATAGGVRAQPAADDPANADPAGLAPPPVSADAPIGRRRPGLPKSYEPPVSQSNIGAVEAPPPEAFTSDPLALAVPDRWRLMETLGLHARWFDPYNQNPLKGDRPIKGTQDWFPRSRRHLRHHRRTEVRADPRRLAKHPESGLLRHLRPLRQPRPGADLHRRRLPLQGIDGVQTAGPRVPRHPGGELQLYEPRRSAAFFP